MTMRIQTIKLPENVGVSNQKNNNHRKRSPKKKAGYYHCISYTMSSGGSDSMLAYSTTGSKNTDSSNDEYRVIHPKESDLSNNLTMESFERPITPIPVVPFCVHCQAHVVTDDSEVELLEDAASTIAKKKGSILVGSSAAKTTITDKLRATRQRREAMLSPRVPAEPTPVRNGQVNPGPSKNRRSLSRRSSSPRRRSKRRGSHSLSQSRSPTKRRSRSASRTTYFQDDHPLDSNSNEDADEQPGIET
jgi:hypothetical protein